MKVGTKSILFGVHAFWWHPFTVVLAWRRLYRKWPNRYAWCAIVSHDLGYWGCHNMDGNEGRQHPLAGAEIAKKLSRWMYRLTGSVYKNLEYRAELTHALALYHSREYSKMADRKPSSLCWADKFCCFYDPAWFYLLRAHLSGEIYEFRANASGQIPDWFTFADWYRWYRLKVLWLPEIQSLLAQRRRSCIFPF